MTAHRYWALLVTARPGTGNGVAIAEVAMRATSGGANIATGGTAGGVDNVGHPPAQAFDGNTATEWRNGATGGLPVRLSYDFGSPVSVAEVVVTVPDAASPYHGGTYGPAACWMQWSDDGTTWRYGSPAADLSGLGDGASATLGSVSDTQPGARQAGTTQRLAPGVTSVQGRYQARLLRYDAADSGPYRLAGTVVIDGTPVTPASRRVRLFDVVSGRMVRQMWSATDGTYEFSKLRAGPWMVVVDDYTMTYEADAATQVMAVP